MKFLLGLVILTVSQFVAQNIRQRQGLAACASHKHACEEPGPNPVILVDSPSLAFNAATPTWPGWNLSQSVRNFAESKTNL